MLIHVLPPRHIKSWQLLVCLHTKQYTTMDIQTTGIPSAFWFIDSNATNQTRSLFECLSVPFFVPFREDYHQSEDGFSTLILTNKIAAGKSETGDDNTAVQCLKFLVHKQHVY